MARLAQFLEAGAFGVLNNILSEFNSDNGYALPNRFEVLVLPPTVNDKFGGPNLDIADARIVSLRCETATVPGRNLNTLTDSNIYGPTREIVDGVTFAEDITLTFQASSELNERKFFEDWQEQAFDQKTWDIGYYNDYTSEIQIYLLDKQDTRRFGIRLIEAFPKTITATELNQSPTTTIVKTSVSFSFRYWEQLDMSKFPAGLGLGGKIFQTVLGTVERSLGANLPSIINKL